MEGFRCHFCYLSLNKESENYKLLRYLVEILHAELMHLR